MTLKERYTYVIDWFERSVPAPESELHYRDPYQLVVAVILSAQCTDKRVNMTTPALFERFPDAASMAQATPEEIFPYIKSISYPNNKAKNLAGMARVLTRQMHGVLPTDPREMERLPGVGRKTANVVAAVLYDKQVMPVDTHVFRVANRIGLAVGRTPRQVEDQLTAHIPGLLLPRAHHWLILHGRYVCTARAPHCEQCGIRPACKWAAKKFGPKAR
jgi:endonuclease-3